MTKVLYRYEEDSGSSVELTEEGNLEIMTEEDWDATWTSYLDLPAKETKKLYHALSKIYRGDSI